MQEEYQYKELTIDDIKDDRGDFKTVFAIETATERRFVHIYGYCYCSSETFSENSYRQLEYTGLYIPLDEVLAIGLARAEMEYQEFVNSYIKDCSIDDVLDAYNNYVGEPDGTTHPPILIDCITADTPDGVYIIK